MSLTKKQHYYGLGFVVLISLFVYLLLPYTSQTLRLANGYAAKYVCSQVYIGEVTLEEARQSLSFFPLTKVKIKWDEEQKVITSQLWGMGKRSAHYYENGRLCGCSLNDTPTWPVNAIIPEKKEFKGDTTAWPMGDQIPKASTKSATIKNVLSAFIQNNQDIKAVCVADKDSLLVEAYAPQVVVNQKLLGWSMTKSFLPLLYGVLDKKSSIPLDQHPHALHWENKKENITWKHLFQMSSGLDWDENYFKVSPATEMLFFSNDIPAKAGKRALEADPGTHWEYSSANSNILSGLLKNTLQSEYYTFLFDSLLDQIGMHSALIETDQTGHFVMSSYAWATARDWTRFGLLFLNEGQWGDETIYDKEWHEFILEASPNSKGHYANQIWLNTGGEYPDVPADAYFADGFGNQRVLVVPSKNVVITVLTGFAPEADLNGLFKEVLNLL